MTEEQSTDQLEPVVQVDTKEVAESIKLSDKEPKPKQPTGKIKDETKALYDEFSDFLEVKADMSFDLGVKEVIPTGIDVLDAILGGGFAVGALNIIVGDPGSGKSMLAIQTMGAGQRKYDQFLATFMDSEEATTTQRLSNLGVTHPRIKPYTDITVEKVFKHLETMCLFKEQKKMKNKPSIAVWDSIANTLSEKERQVDDINQVIGYKARLLSILVPKYVARCAQYNICWLAVNQLRDVLNLTQFAAPKDLRFMSTGKSMPGGNVLKFNAFTLLELKAKSVLDPAKMGFDGFIATIKTVKSKLFPPNIKIEVLGNFVFGFSNFWTNYHLLAKEKRIQTGSWNIVTSDPEQKKFRTKDAEKMYKTDERFRNLFDEAVTECIKTEIIDKYNPEI